MKHEARIVQRWHKWKQGYWQTYFGCGVDPLCLASGDEETLPGGETSVLLCLDGGWVHVLSFCQNEDVLIFDNILDLRLSANADQYVSYEGSGLCEFHPFHPDNTKNFILKLDRDSRAHIKIHRTQYTPHAEINDVEDMSKNVLPPWALGNFGVVTRQLLDMPPHPQSQSQPGGTTSQSS
eukprot:Trichotokara_eunicae@DN8849_c0_g1_i1.p1